MPTGCRARNRLIRSRRYLRAALRIATDEGLDALTMQRLADSVDAAVGTVYSYVPSKGALVAEVQREAIDRLAASALLLRTDSDRLAFDEGLSDGDLAAFRVIAFGRWFCASAVTFPEEIRLMQSLMGNGGRTCRWTRSTGCCPPAMALLDQARACIDAAEQHGALAPGDSMARVVTLAASVGGVLQVSKLDEIDAELFDGVTLAEQLCVDLLRGWGISDARLQQSNRLLGPVIGLGITLGWMLGYLFYEMLHWRAHARPPGGRYELWLRRHHFHHHFGHPMANHGVTTSLRDHVYGSFERPDRIRVPRRLAMGGW